MSTIAYALRAEHTGTVEVDGETVPAFGGGLLNIDDTRDLNVAEALEAGDGIIVVDDSDTLAIARLDAYPPLKRVDAAEHVLTVDQYADANRAALDTELKRRGIGGLSATNDAKVSALHADDARQAAGEPVPDPYTVEALTAATPEA